MVNSHPDEFEYTYYDDDRAEHHNGSLTFHVPSATSVRVVLVILLRVGFVLIHVGSVPVNNVNLILLQNVVDVCWATMAYAMVGYLIAYNGDGNGLIGEGYWIGDAAVDKDEALIGWSLVVIAAAICTSGVVGRMHTVGYLLMGFLLAGLVQPFLIHWIWTPGGWIKKNLLNGSAVRFRDYAGATVVHLVGGLSGLMGCVALGRRILRLSAIDDASIATGTSGTVFAESEHVERETPVRKQNRRPHLSEQLASRVFVQRAGRSFPFRVHRGGVQSLDGNEMRPSHGSWSGDGIGRNGFLLARDSASVGRDREHRLLLGLENGVPERVGGLLQRRRYPRRLRVFGQLLGSSVRYRPECRGYGEFDAILLADDLPSHCSLDCRDCHVCFLHFAGKLGSA
ncbi:amt-2-like protein isoform X2 [Nomia melanderi]|uniref:amt-2-like protein isoform X2 n=1 Tax=Nomia melanderi TaxID=2448451 RepID=UPI003FCE603A